MRVYYGFWKDKNNRKEYASKCSSRMDFKTKYSSAYKSCTKEELIEYFGKKLSFDERYIYKYEFKDKNIYIGLTCNKLERHYQHLNIKGAVFDYIKKTNEIPDYSLLTNNSIKEEDIGELERFIISQYKELGYNILNKSTGGELGSGIRKWTKEKIEQEIKKYPTRGKLKKGNEVVYNKLRKTGLINNYYPL